MNKKLGEKNVFLIHNGTFQWSIFPSIEFGLRTKPCYYKIHTHPNTKKWVIVHGIPHNLKTWYLLHGVASRTSDPVGAGTPPPEVPTSLGIRSSASIWTRSSSSFSWDRHTQKSFLVLQIFGRFLKLWGFFPLVSTTLFSFDHRIPPVACPTLKTSLIGCQ